MSRSEPFRRSIAPLLSVAKVRRRSNPDSVFTQFFAAGLSPINAVHKEHDWRVGRVVDPFGLEWEIAGPLDIS